MMFFASFIFPTFYIGYVGKRYEYWTVFSIFEQVAVSGIIEGSSPGVLYLPMKPQLIITDPQVSKGKKGIKLS